MTLYFYLDCSTLRASFSVEKLGFELPDSVVRPRKQTFRDEKLQIRLCCSIELEKQNSSKSSSHYFALLKSNLQKQVRRRRKNAVATVEEMYRLNPFETLRRMAVIAAEDSMICRELSTITWLLMAGSKGYYLNSKLVTVYLQNLVWNLLGTERCRFLETHRFEDFVDFERALEHSDELAGLVLRCGYGGLKNDPRLIYGQILEVLENKIPFEYHSSSMKIFDEGFPLRFSRAAYDHHIDRRLPEILWSEDPDLCRKTIWECSSSTNCRHERSVPSECIELWEKIRENFGKYTKVRIKQLSKSKI